MRFLIAIDNSSQAEKILQFSTQFMHSVDEPFTILTVIERNKDYQQASAFLTKACEMVGLENINLTTKIRAGHPAEEIIREAEEFGYELVIVGEGKHRNLATRFLLGSTSIRVAEHAPCPVIIVKGAGKPIHQILLCVSGAKNTLVHSRTLSKLANLLDGEEQISVLHVMSQISAWPGVSDKDLRASAEDLIKEHSPEGEFLDQIVRLLKQSGISSHVKVRHGLVVDEILAETQSGNYDLIVLGAHSSDGWQRHLLDDLTRRLMVQSTMPVLVVR